MTDYREYESASQAVKDNYYKMRTRQTHDHNVKVRELINNHEWKKYNIWDVIEKLHEFIDISDPDVNLPNIHHLFQTAEGIRKDGGEDWYQLVGLLHDLGKALFFVINDDELGLSIKEQWGIVGDTFIVGAKLPDECIYPHYNKDNPDMQDNKYNTNLGIYTEGCGLDNIMCSYGHDEYLHRVLLYNGCKIPDKGMYMIRYHSLYPWHTGGAYRQFMNKKDHDMLPHVRDFNKYDLYTKENLKSNVEELKAYYDVIIKKYVNKDGVIYL
jgi:inositol oxygenase